eukprot:7818912-Heterocapsa_arctica.AAC.1
MIVVDGFGNGVTFDSLAISGEERYRSLDIKFSTSLGKIVRSGPASLAADLRLKEHAAAMNGDMLMGRQIDRHFQTNPKMDFTYGIENLGELKWRGDNGIPGFLFCWRQIISRVKVKLNDEALAETLYKHMENNK